MKSATIRVTSCLQNLALITLISAAASFSALAGTKTHNGTGSLSGGTNWSPAGTPTTSDEALITGTPNAAVTTALGTNLTFGDFIFNSNVSSTLGPNSTGSTNTNWTLSGGGGSTAAIANGGASGDLLVIGTSATSNTVTLIDNAGAGTGKMKLILGAVGNINVVNSGATLSASLVVDGTNGLTKTGAGTLILQNANTYTGTTTLNAGTLGLGSNNALNGTALTINGGTIAASGATRTLSSNITVGGDFSIGGLGSAIVLNGTVGLGGTTRTVTLAGNSVTLGGVISNGSLTVETTSATRSLTLNGAGSNTYTGLTTINGGTVTLAKTGGAIAIAGDLTINTGSSTGTVLLGASSQIATTSTITVNTGGTLDMSTFNNSATNIVLAGGAINGSGTLTGLTNAIDVRSGFASAVLAGSVGLIKSTSGTVTLSASNTYTGATTISGGTLALSGAGAIANGSAVNVTGGTATFDISAITASSETVGSLAGVSGSTVALGAKNLTAGGDNTSTTFAGALSGTGGSFTKEGSGTTIFSGSNDYTGTTTINSGTLQIGDAGSTGTLGTGAVTNNASLVFNRSGNFVLNNAISGTGTLTQSGSNIITIASANTYSGATAVTSGTLRVTANDALGTAAAGTTVNSGGALRLSGVSYTTAEALSINGTGVGGTGALYNTGGDSTYAGQITAATNATIRADNVLTLTGGLVKNGTTLTMTGGGSVIVNGTGISGASANSDLIVDGTTLVVNAASNYNGPTTVQNSGTLVSNADITSTQVNISANSTLSGTSSVTTAGGSNYVYLNGALVVGDSTLGSPVASTFDLKSSGAPGSTVMGTAFGSFLYFDLFQRGGDLTSTAAAADYIRLFGTMDATAGGTLFINDSIAGAHTFADGDKWRLFDLTTGPGSISGSLAVDYSSLALGVGLTGSFNSSTGVFSIFTVPEPSRALLLMLGACGVMFPRRRSRVIA